VDVFSQLLIDAIPRLRRYARSLLGDAQQAEDLVQDCLDRAWSRMAQWQADSNMRAWLFTIMHNLYVNQVRRDSRQNDWESLANGEPVDRSRQAQDRAMDLRDLEKGLARLSDNQREVLMLVCLEGMTYEQVGEILGIPTGTVMSRLHRAREELRRWLRGEDSPRLRRVK
jgi:RNA polymerase sigma-70 factor (ECF subfamily)